MKMDVTKAAMSYSNLMQVMQEKNQKKAPKPSLWSFFIAFYFLSFLTLG